MAGQFYDVRRIVVNSNANVLPVAQNSNRRIWCVLQSDPDNGDDTYVFIDTQVASLVTSPYFILSPGDCIKFIGSQETGSGIKWDGGIYVLGSGTDTVIGCEASKYPRDY